MLPKINYSIIIAFKHIIIALKHIYIIMFSNSTTLYRPSKVSVVHISGAFFAKKNIKKIF